MKYHFQINEEQAQQKIEQAKEKVRKAERKNREWLSKAKGVVSY